ncbi:MAG: FtsQ-type POTRA domain-containing protein [Oscillospiraceae bacterium]|jgi:outer membrane protein assembly factor BamA|nr:FtsQ-type POTRA domain-containing protein [Oscillospiraceae bacterium]
MRDLNSGTNRFAQRESAGVPSRAGIRAENRRRRRRRALLIFYIFLFFAVVAAAIIVSLTVLFKIDAIQVTGTSRYSSNQILSVCGIQKGENLFLAKTKQAESSIQTRLPYIGSVEVRRKFPAQISIQVTAAKICGAVKSSEKYVVLGDNFRVLEIADKPPQNCASILGIALKNPKVGSTAVFADQSLQSSFEQIETALKGSKFTKITQMDFSSTSEILLTYDGRVTINLGMPSALDYKISFAKKLFDSNQIKDTEKGVLNLSLVEENDTAYFDPAVNS